MGFLLRDSPLKLKHTAWPEHLLGLCGGGRGVLVSVCLWFHLPASIPSGRGLEANLSLKAQWSPMKKCVVFSLQHSGWQCVYWVWLWELSPSLGPVCLSLTLAAASKISTLKKNKQRNALKELPEHKDDTEMSAEGTSVPLSLSSILNSHHVLNSQAGWKLHVFALAEILLYIYQRPASSELLSYSCQDTQTDSKPQSITRSHYTASTVWALGRHFRAQLHWKLKIYMYTVLKMKWHSLLLWYTSMTLC